MRLVGLLADSWYGSTVRYSTAHQYCIQHVGILVLIKVACAADLYALVQVNMSSHSGINFRGLVYLIDEATRPKAAQQTTAEQQTQQMQATA